MAGDYTRMTFEPRKDHAGVLMQQGRVTLDSDWNELVELIDRRFRAETVDIIGRCVVPSETPDGFLIGLAGGTLTIGRGRAYVHGLLAENHGADPTEFDAVLEELRGTGPVAYVDQPYLPNAAAVAPLPSTGTHIAYLDVWQREVTHLEDYELVEKAIGVDTATRLQTAWQVRLLAAPAGTTCDSDVDAWNDLVAPSAGRLTTAAVGVPAPTDPCTIPPSGGYRGTENRLYRVEIHDDGPLGTATFKWSRDNGSIAAHVEGIDPARTTLTLTRLGRDSVQRIRVDDWVEVTDDWRELNGLPGELRRVASVDEVEQTIGLATALSAGAFDATDLTRHTRVRRWDQSGPTVNAAGGVVAVPATAGTAIVLEDGVQISFALDPAGGAFRVGDYWVFAARTADASVEELVDEPPRGIHHHFCRLAVVTFPGSVVDCRTLWPPDVGDHGCDCTVCVTPESHASGELTIQKAIDIVVAAGGGKVCLQVGFYRVDRAVRIAGAQSVSVHGRGWRTVIVSGGREPAFVVERSIGVTLAELTVLTTTLAQRGAVPMGIAVLLRNTVGTVVERCVLAQLGLIGTTTTRLTTASVAALGPRAAGAPLIALDGPVLESLLHENVLVGTNGIGPLWADLSPQRLLERDMDPGLDTSLKSSAAQAVSRGSGYVVTSDLIVEDNLFVCWLTGVALEGYCLHIGETRIAGNSVLGCLRAGISSTGLSSGGGRVEVLRNLVRVAGYGIAVGVDDTRVTDNDVGPPGLRTPDDAAGPSGRRAAGILLAPSLRPAGLDRCLVRGNRVVGVAGVGIEITARVNSAVIAENVIQGTRGDGIAMTERALANVLTIEGNQLLDIASREGTRGDVVAGVLLTRVADAAVLANTILRVGRNAAVPRLRAGIAAGGCERLRVADNDVAEIGPADDFVGMSTGVVADGFVSAEIVDNVLRRGEPPRAPGRAAWLGILVGRLDVRLLTAQPAAPATAATATEAAAAAPAVQPAAATGLSFVTGPVLGMVPEAVVGNQRIGGSGAGGFAFAVARGRDTVGIHGNLVEAYGGVPAVLVSTEGSCLFNDNRCFLVGVRRPVAQIEARSLVVGDNYVEGLRDTTSLSLAAGRFTVAGNVVSGPIEVGGAPLGPPWNQLNVI